MAGDFSGVPGAYNGRFKDEYGHPDTVQERIAAFTEYAPACHHPSVPFVLAGTVRVTEGPAVDHAIADAADALLQDIEEAL